MAFVEVCANERQRLRGGLGLCSAFEIETGRNIPHAPLSAHCPESTAHGGVEVPGLGLGFRV